MLSQFIFWLILAINNKKIDIGATGSVHVVTFKYIAYGV